ncbi:hypothetical protein DOK_02396 [gamma proteobacterium BDW918]|jgi:hypothetical protein|uniref:Uncharacterized protein n=1 Tax=Zhongshania aliphaticivorans TaxID=1470434 RepID=A0A127M3L6_9GAMM|nr:hypothetical protein AZF00_05780 [Zhongshania aliphaticivorans]EIF44654.1 hypothetical protein DOK_02396 [gamma proteobacterium BDW918]
MRAKALSQRVFTNNLHVFPFAFLEYFCSKSLKLLSCHLILLIFTPVKFLILLIFTNSFAATIATLCRPSTRAAGIGNNYSVKLRPPVSA